MKDFGRWFTDQGQAEQQLKPQEEADDMLPDGVWERGGKYMANCRSCDYSYEISWDVEKEGFDPDMSYCGRSDRCIP